jgi:ethanolamine ammonia-lyase large subunit
MRLKTKLFGKVYEFKNIKDVMNKASSKRAGDTLAGIAAASNQERVAAKVALANTLLKDIYENPSVPYDDDEVTRVIIDAINVTAYSSIKNLTVAEFREWLMDTKTTESMIKHACNGMTSEMVAAVAKLMSNLDLIYVSRKLRTTRCCNTRIGDRGTLASRLQPNDTTDNLDAISAVIYEGLSYGVGDAMIALNPVEDTVSHMTPIYHRLEEIKQRLEVPTQICILAHVTTQMECLKSGAPVDLIFQSLAGSQKSNESFGINVAMLDEASDLAKHYSSAAGPNFMYFETGEGTEYSSEGDFGTDQATMESRCYGLAKRYSPFLINTVLGFIGPEYIYDRQQQARCALENHFCAKLQDIAIGADDCYVNHMDCDQNDLENTAVLLSMAGCYYFMGIPQGDDPMLMYQSNSFHDTPALREALGLEPAADFKVWLEKWGLWEEGHIGPNGGDASIFLK